MIQNIWRFKGTRLYKQERRAQAIVFYSDIVKKDLILDIGCAEGFITSHLSNAEFVVGLDISKDSILIAKTKVKGKNFDFILADAAALPVRQSCFDKILVSEVLEHLPKEKREFVCKEVLRVLKEKKKTIITVPYKEVIFYTTCIHCGKLTPHAGHLCSFDEEKLSKLLSDFSYVVSCWLPNVPKISLSKIFQYLPFRIWLSLNNLLGRKSKGSWIIVKCEK